MHSYRNGGNIMEKNFSETLGRLEEISKILEKGECSLEDAVKLYEEGVTLAKECNEKLTAAKQKVAKLNVEE